MKFEIKNRWTGKVQFTADIEAKKSDSEGIKIGLAVMWAVKNGANLDCANLSGANLSGTDLSGANLSGVNLSDADLSGADLSRTNLSSANLSGANLFFTNLSGADLSRTNLSGAGLFFTNLPRKDIDKIDFQICPEQGAFQAWKALANKHIALIEIPSDAARTSTLTGRKCRAEKVKVLKIYKGKKTTTKPVPGWKDKETIYRRGKITTADEWDDDPRKICTAGIHFFMTRKEAEDWNK